MKNLTPRNHRPVMVDDGGHVLEVENISGFVLEPVTYETLAAQIHFQNIMVGWWDEWPNRIDRHSTAMMLVLTELSEACEADRKNLQDSHLPHRYGVAVELADTVIRLLDMAGALGVSDLTDRIGNCLEMAVEVMAVKTVPEMLFHISKAVTIDDPRKAIKVSMTRVVAIAEIMGLDLWVIVAEKREYNRHRQDHKRSVRANEHGKAY